MGLSASMTSAILAEAATLIDELRVALEDAHGGRGSVLSTDTPLRDLLIRADHFHLHLQG